MNSITIKSISDTFQELAAQLIEAEPASQISTQDQAQSPTILSEAMQKVLELLAHIEAQQSIGKPDQESNGNHDIHTLGDYGFNLLADLSSLAGDLKQNDLSHSLEALTLPLAIWIARQGGELRTIEPIVNALAYQANSIREPLELEQLYELTGEIQDALTPTLQQDLEKTNPGRPWRVLQLNRAIIATRSHRPELIETAYEHLVRNLPEEAPEFFRQGMQQMDALDYPQPVRRVVEKYFNLWSIKRTIH